jgi:nitroreductase
MYNYSASTFPLRVCALHRFAVRFHRNTQIDPYSRWWLEDGSAAIQNMLVASTALGYGSCWVEGDALPHEEQFKTLLYIPKGKRLLALVPVGVPAEWPTIEKRPLESVLHWQVY